MALPFQVPWVPSVPPWLPLQRLAVVAGVVLSLVAVWRLSRPEGRWGRRLRTRFVLGVPWGTLLVVVGVAAVYLFVQRGIDGLRSPLVIPFRSWSYLYPLGMVTAAFSHAGLGHVTGNLLATLVFAPIAEYAWGHFPRERGTQSFSSLRTNPFARILAFVGAVFAVGLVTSLFSVGPVIGFSGVVFAFAGFALVTRPLTTVLALFVSRIVGLVESALRNPLVTRSGREQFVTPWWADIAIQGHALGLFVGAVAGAAWLRRRDRSPAAWKVWFAALSFAVFQSLWALYWFRGGGRFVLFRAAGTAFVFLLAALIASALSASDRPLVETIDLDRREAAAGLLAALLIATSVAAVPINFATVADPEPPGESVAVRDYRITYAEGVENQLVSVVNVSAFGETTAVTTSGVIVISERRHVWQTFITRGRLAFSGREIVRVGGLGWEEQVIVNRTGWSAAGGGATYQVYLRRIGEPRRLVFTAGPARAEPVIRGYNVTLAAADPAFEVRLGRNNSTVATRPIPPPGGNVTARGITFERRGRALFAAFNDTRVRIGAREEYN